MVFSSAENRNERADEVLELLSVMHERVSRIEKALMELHESMASQNATKDWYSTVEVAELLSRKPYTVREWCRLGRINAEKTLSGRGIDEEWRISHAEIERYQNEGLLPLLGRY